MQYDATDDRSHVQKQHQNADDEHEAVADHQIDEPECRQAVEVGRRRLRRGVVDAVDEQVAPPYDVTIRRRSTVCHQFSQQSAEADLEFRTEGLNCVPKSLAAGNPRTKLEIVGEIL